MAVLASLSLVFAAAGMLGLLGLLGVILRLLLLIDAAIRDVDRTRRRIALDTAPLGDQLAVLTAAAASTSNNLTAAVMAIRRARSAVEKGE